MKNKLSKSFYLIFALLIIMLCVSSCKEPIANENDTDSSQNEFINGSEGLNESGSQSKNDNASDEAEDQGEIDDGIVDDVAKDVF